MSNVLRKVYFIEEVIIGALMRLVDERVNEILAEGELSVPPLDVCGLPGGRAVYPEFFLSSGERMEKERMLRVDVYSVSITFTVPDRDDAEAYCYAYAAAVDSALEENPALNGAVSRAALTGKKYVPPKTPHCGEEWKLVLSVRVTVDAVIIGQFAGKDALASIDAIYNLTKLPVNFFVGLSTGATIIISQYVGAKDGEKLSMAVHTAVAFAFSGGLILSIAGILLAPACLHLLRVPGEIYNYTLSYARIYFAGMAVSMTYNIGAGILRAVGNSKTPFYFLIAASTANVILDLLFVGVFRMSTAGSAFATVLSQLLSAILVITALLKTDLPCRIAWKKIRFHKPVVKKIFSLGLPVDAQSSLYPISNMMIQSNINSFGTNAIAAWAVCGKLDFLIWLIVDSFGSAISTFVAQNCGARLYGRAKSGVLICVGMSLACVCAISVVLYFACGTLGRLFISDNEVIKLSIYLMRFLAPLYFLYIGGEVLSGAIRGTGETFKPMVLTLLCTCACRVVWVLFAVPLQPTLKMVIWSYPVSWIVTSLSFIVFYQIHKSKRLCVP